MKRCPNCKNADLQPTDQVVDMQQILDRWESEIHIEFPAKVREQYAELCLRPIILYRCQDCGFSTFLPIAVGTHDFYAAITSTEAGYYVSDKWEFRQAALFLEKNSPARVLDFGCGSGEFISYLKGRMDVDAYGFDFNPFGVDVAKAKGYQLIENIDADIVSGAPFDAITMFQVLEHLGDPFETIEKLKDLLRPGGILIITIPDASGPISNFPNALTELPPHHVTRWHDDSLKLCVSERGFDVIDILHEPLPDYLWDSYLPIIIERNFLPGLLGKVARRVRIVHYLALVLRALGVKNLPIRGHTLLAIMRKRAVD